MAEKYPETPEGGVAFIRAFVEAFNRGSSDPKRADDLRAFFDPRCESCVGLHQGLVDYGKDGLRQKGTAITIAKIRPEFVGGQRMVVAKLKQNAGDLVDASGTKKDVVPGDDDLRQAFMLERRPSGWTIVEIRRYVDEV